MEQVILLHGILRTGRSMRRMERKFARAGYKVFNITYPSRKLNIQKIAEVIPEKLKKLGYDENARTHMVCHSMGGLVARVLIANSAIKNLGRVVFLGTPHKGSEVADAVKNWWVYRRVMGPAGQELNVRENNFLSQLKPIDFEAAGIAGYWSLSFVGSYIIGRQSDGTVAVDSVKIDGLRDFLTVPVPHSFLMQSGRVIKACIRFIRDAKF